MGHAPDMWRPEVRRSLYLLGQGGCPACRAAQHAVATHLRWLLIENYRTMATILTLSRGGYCPVHARLLLELDASQLSFTFQALVGVELADLAALGPRARHLHPRSDPCPACRAGEVAATVVLGDLQALWREAGGRAAFEAADGLCRPHLRRALREAEPRLRQWLVGTFGRRGRTGRIPRRQACALLWGTPAVPSPAEALPPDDVVLDGSRGTSDASGDR